MQNAAGCWRDFLLTERAAPPEPLVLTSRLGAFIIVGTGLGCSFHPLICLLASVHTNDVGSVLVRALARRRLELCITTRATSCALPHQTSNHRAQRSGEFLDAITGILF